MSPTEKVSGVDEQDDLQTTRLHAHPWPIFTRLRYNRVGSASVQICCNLLTISASFALSSFFFSRRLGVAPAVFAKLATAILRRCGAGRSEYGCEECWTSSLWRQSYHRQTWTVQGRRDVPCLE